MRNAKWWGSIKYDMLKAICVPLFSAIKHFSLWHYYTSLLFVGQTLLAFSPSLVKLCNQAYIY